MKASRRNKPPPKLPMPKDKASPGRGQPRHLHNRLTIFPYRLCSDETLSAFTQLGQRAEPLLIPCVWLIAAYLADGKCQPITITIPAGPILFAVAFLLMRRESEPLASHG